MLGKLGWVTIWSQDLNNLLPFYRDMLGLKVSMQGPGFIALEGNEEGPAICLGTHSEVKGPATDPYRHMIGLITDDVEGDFRRLSAAGIEFIEEPTPYDDVLMATLKDPEGNIVQLSQMKG
jgi:lactoylglutathione lyase